MANDKIEVGGVPKSSNEYETWISQGRTFDSSTGKWYEKATTPTTTPTNNTSYLSNLLNVAGDRGLDVSQILTNPNYVPPATPVEKYDYSAATSSANLLAEQLKSIQAQKDEAAKKLSEAGKESATDMASLISSYKPQTIDITGATTAAETKYGTDDLLAKLQTQNVKVASLQGELQKLETEELTAIDTAEGRMASRGAIEGEKDTITRAYNIKKAYKSAELYAEAAVAQAYSSNYTEAQKLVTRAVDAYTTEIKQEIENYNNLFSLQSDWIQSLRDDEKDLLKMKYDELVKEEENVRDEKNAVLELMMNNPSAGIMISDTVESASAKVAKYAQLHPGISQTLGSAETGYTMYDKYGNVIGSRAGVSAEDSFKLTNSQVISGATLSGKTIAEFKSLPLDDQVFYLTRYQDELDYELEEIARSGFANVASKINNSTAISQEVKTKMLRDLEVASKSALGSQTLKLGVSDKGWDFDSGDVVIYDSESGKSTKLSDEFDLDSAAAGLKYGGGILGFYGSNVSQLVASIGNYINEERAKRRTDAAILEDIRTYLNEGISNTAEIDNPLYKK
jgi:hypothetical protein